MNFQFRKHYGLQWSEVEYLTTFMCIMLFVWSFILELNYIVILCLNMHSKNNTSLSSLEIGLISL